MTWFLGNGGREWERIKDYLIKSCDDSLEYFIYFCHHESFKTYILG
jgi:hypothetical protein